jgi:hypothetical protein
MTDKDLTTGSKGETLLLLLLLLSILLLLLLTPYRIQTLAIPSTEGWTVITVLTIQNANTRLSQYRGSAYIPESNRKECWAECRRYNPSETVHSLTLNKFLLVNVICGEILRGLVVGVPVYSSRGPGSIPRATRFSEK